MRASWLGPLSVVTVCACAVGACSAASTAPGFTAGNGGSSSGTQGNGAATGNGGSASTGVAFDAGMVTSTGAGGATMVHAYAHTNTTLFQLDPTQATLGLTQIGDFDCIGGSGQDTSMTDLAVNDTGDLWAVSDKNFYQVTLPSGGTGPVHCTATPLVGTSGAYFYGLTFAPVGTISTTAEVLVAADTSGALWAIDTTNGSVTQHGTFGVVPPNDGQGHTYKYAGKAWELSGNIVFLANGGNPLGFATVRDCSDPPYSSSTDCDATDTLIEIDTTLLATAGAQVVTKKVLGQVVKSATCNDPNNSSYGSMYGIAAYGSNVYGFSHEGSIVLIDNTDGTACLALSTSSDTWAGAAISTLAYVVPPTAN